MKTNVQIYNVHQTQTNANANLDLQVNYVTKVSIHDYYS